MLCLRSLILLFALTRFCSAAEWFVAVDGNDAAPGTKEQPFATVMRAQEAAAAGDTVQIRGGTYRMPAPPEQGRQGRRGLYHRIISLTKSGEKGKPITYRAFGDERPVFDCSDVKPAGKRVAAFFVQGHWLHLIGLDVTGVQVTIQRHTQSICFASEGSHNIFERLTMHDGQAIGIYHVNGSDNLFLNCDAWNNWDYTSEGGRGGNVDGFGCHPPKGSTGNVFRGCRAWFNSDDGYDCLMAHEPVIFENCWAAWNGYTKDKKKAADGNGFKAGGYAATPARDLPNPIPRHVVRYCIAAANKASGFYANHHPGGIDWHHNTSFGNNGSNFSMLNREADNIRDVDGYGHRLFNNLSYGAARDIVHFDPDKCKTGGNSFTLALKLKDSDFQSLDMDELFAPRQKDGSLPALKFMRPAKASQLSAGGVTVPEGNKQKHIGALSAGD